jgi:hypothetical protein
MSGKFEYVRSVNVFYNDKISTKLNNYVKCAKTNDECQDELKQLHFYLNHHNNVNLYSIYHKNKYEGRLTDVFNKLNRCILNNKKCEIEMYNFNSILYNNEGDDYLVYQR